MKSIVYAVKERKKIFVVKNINAGIHSEKQKHRRGRNLGTLAENPIRERTNHER
jgi:hypothetical protein